MNKDFRKAVDNRLSGMTMRPELKQNILDKMTQEGEIVVKKKISMGLVLALVLALALTGAAIALNTNLFFVFSKNDAALQYVAENAKTAVTTFTAAIDAANDPIISMDSTYFDGSNLFLSYRIINGNSLIESYTPSADELQGMRQENYMIAIPVQIAENAVIKEYLKNYQAGIAGGYHVRSIERSDHAITIDGTDVPWISDSVTVDDKDLVCYIKFESPLPSSLQTANEFTLNLKYYQTDLYVWFDGQGLYSKSVIGNKLIAPIDVLLSVNNPDIQMSGQGEFNGKPITIKAVVSPIAITLRYPKTEGLQFAIFDPATGEEPFSRSISTTMEQGILEQTFDGLGRVPEKLIAYPIEFVEIAEPNKETSNIIYLKEQGITLVP